MTSFYNLPLIFAILFHGTGCIGQKLGIVTLNTRHFPRESEIYFACFIKILKNKP
jgi:hypothetical protein